VEEIDETASVTVLVGRHHHDVIKSLREKHPYTYTIDVNYALIIVHKPAMITRYFHRFKKNGRYDVSDAIQFN
jgi:hypothetical protein